MLQTKSLSVTSTDNILLDGINVIFQPGELTVILGANGAGKSTLLHALTGGDMSQQHNLHYQGEISFCNIPLQQWASHELARQRAIMPQHVNLDFPFLAKEVVTMGRSPHNNSTHNNDIVNRAMMNLV